MLKPLLCAAMAAVLCAPAAWAQDAGQLNAECAAPDRAFCAAYVAGVVDTLRMLSYKTAGGFFCAPQGTPPERYLSVTTAYLDAHPDRMKFNAAGEVMLALMQAFPCERAGEQQLPLPPGGQPLPPRDGSPARPSN